MLDVIGRFLHGLFGVRYHGIKATVEGRKAQEPPPRPVAQDAPAGGRMPSWRVIPPGRGACATAFVVRARTKSEARALAKTRLGVPRKKGLPAGTKLRRL